ncbi:MAG TPA: 3-hydroxyacyl-CoA dehydrogenase NAD-binding domain-containing protein, partial [Saprospiraceae bacterium]|nr:3-hydroxyacyl-CoA dehydrogenase NAD-binding domain-containing protein [Saprospiraceae bacterium]
MKNVVVIGAGTMGNGIAHVFAMNGFNTTIVDISDVALNKALATITKNLDRMIAKGSLSEEQKQTTLANLSTSVTMENAVPQADLVVEAATENIDLKLNIFKNIDALVPAGTILASNTSSISITKIASVTNRPDKVIGMHFMNPVPVMKLVEV